MEEWDDAGAMTSCWGNTLATEWHTETEELAHIARFSSLIPCGSTASSV